MNNTFLKTVVGLIFSIALSQTISAATVTKYYTVKEFTKLKVGTAFHVEFIHSNENKVVVEIDAENADDIFIGNENSEVTIKMKDYGNYNTRTMKATVYGNSLTEIFISGASRFISNFTFTEKNIDVKTSGASRVELSLDTENLDIDISGASKLIVKGNAKKQTIDISGASNYNGKECKSSIVDIDASGASKVIVNCSDLLDAVTSGASQVNYISEPKKIKRSTSGSSEIELK